MTDIIALEEESNISTLSVNAPKSVSIFSFKITEDFLDSYRTKKAPFG